MTETIPGVSVGRNRTGQAATASLTPRDAAEALVEAHDLGRTFQHGPTRLAALRGVSCTVRARDRIALVGPSGGGKSTLLHLLGGIDAPSTGSISWPALGGPADLRPHNVALVLQTPSLLPALTAVENVELPLLMMRREPSAARRVALECLERFELAALTDLLPEELSSGQGQRVALVRAVACGARLLLADEPSGQLDRATADQVIERLLEALSPTDTALVVATHDSVVAGRMDATWHLDHGIWHEIRC